MIDKDATVRTRAATAPAFAASEAPMALWRRLVGECEREREREKKKREREE